MGTRIKNYILIALGIGAFYYLLSHHIIFTSFRDFNVFNKTELTFKYTFVSARQVSPEKLLRIDPLREAGLGDLMLKRGMISEERLENLLERIESEGEAESED